MCVSSSLDRSRELSPTRGAQGSPLKRPCLIGFVDGTKRAARRGAPSSLARLAHHDVEVRYIALAKQPDFAGVDLLVATDSDTVAAAECAVRRQIPLLIASDEELATLADDLDRLSVTLHAMLTVKLDGRGERLVVADCVIEPDGAGVVQVEIDRATAIRRKLVVATADPFGLRDHSPTFTDPGVELTIDHDDRGATRLAPLSLVVARSSRSGDRLVVSCDGGTYRGIAQEVKVHSTERLPLVRRDPIDHDSPG